jgi:hypothetical protein
VFGQLLSTVVDALLSIPPVRFVMSLVDARWRPLWAALWVAVIAYVLSRTMNQLALRRARLRLVDDPRELGAAPTSGPRSEPATDAGSDASPPSSPTPASAASRTAPRARATPLVPLPIVGAAMVVGAAAVIVTAMLLRPAKPNDQLPAVPLVAPESTPPREGALDVRWRSGRTNDDDCIGTFEVTRGSGTRARFVAFVMDSSGGVMARDSARVESAVSGLLVDFRFRHVDCDEIADWQLQATTPKLPTAPAADR